MKKTKILSLLLSLSLFCTLIAPGTTAYAEGKTKSGSGDNGMKISKTATANKDGSYTITLEAFATGEKVTTSVEKEIPTDIILVLDNSGSMKNDIGRVKYTQYASRDTQNQNNYARRHNGGSANLWHKLDDGSYVSVSVTKTTTYNALDAKLPNYKRYDECYWKYKENLYEKVGDEYKKVELDDEYVYYQGYRYTYTFADGTTVVSDGNDTEPNLGRHAPLYTPVADGNDTVYTYTYTDSTGTEKTIGSSTGASTSFTPAFYKRSTTTGGGSRLQALKNAANAFAEQVDTKAKGKDGQYGTSDDLDHRIAVVRFSSEAKDLTNGLVAMNKDGGLTTVKNAVNGINASGDTYPAEGLNEANRIFERNPVQEGTKRNRVIVLFTDGYPAEYGKDSINYGLSDDAIASAYISKNTYGATVYTVGIFSGANPAGDINANFDYGNRRDSAKQLVAANRYMHYTSSNYKSAMSLRNGGNKDKNGYYLSADNADDLNAIFNKIQQNVTTGSSHSTLNSEAVVKDVISPYFTLPDGATEKNIEINTYKCIGKDGDTYKWSPDSDGNGGATATVNGDKVSVTGFNFSENWCGTERDAQGNTTVRGKKLVISFKVEPKEGFLGGNDVYTNTNAGIYANSNAKEPIMTFDRPTVNVPIKNVTVTANDKNVYLLGDVTADQLKKGATVKVGDVPLNLSMANDTTKPYGLEPWQTEYVNIAVKVMDKDGHEIPADGLKNLTEDTTYTVEVIVSPTTAGNSTEEKGTAATTQPGTAKPKINVFKPELTFKDSEAYYGADEPDYNGNLTKTEWKHGDTVSTDAGVTMFGEEPKLDITYTPETGKIEGNKINTKQDIGVDATVKIQNTDITDKTNFQHQKCTDKTCTLPEGKEFLIHVKTCTLNITKQGGADNESYVFNVLKDGNKYSEVTIWGNGTETLYELPVGNYTIEENTGWSWRYTANNGSGAELTAQNHDGEIICNNTKNNHQWLNGFSEVVPNIYNQSH